MARKGFEKNVEIIISDNASSDGTFEYLQTLKYENFYVYKNSENLGFNKNVILLLEKYARGVYCWSLGDDDYVSSKAIQSFMLHKYDTDLYFMRHKIIKENELEIECEKIHNTEIMQGSYIDAIAEGSNLFATFMSYAIFKKALFNSVDKTKIMVNNWKHFENVFFNGYSLYKAFGDLDKVYWSKDYFIYIVPIIKDWDDKLLTINTINEQIPNFAQNICTL